MDKKEKEVEFNGVSLIPSSSYSTVLYGNDNPPINEEYIPGLTRQQYEQYVVVILAGIKLINKLILNLSSSLFEDCFKKIKKALDQLEGYELNVSSKEEIQSALNLSSADWKSYIGIELGDNYQIMKTFMKLKLKIAAPEEFPQILAECIIYELKRIERLIEEFGDDSDVSNNEMLAKHLGAVGVWLKEFEPDQVKKINKVIIIRNLNAIQSKLLIKEIKNFDSLAVLSNLQGLCKSIKENEEESDVSEIKQRKLSKYSSFEVIGQSLREAMHQGTITSSQSPLIILQLVQDIKKWIPNLQYSAEYDKAIELIQEKFEVIGLILSHLKWEKLSLYNYSKEIGKTLRDIREEIDNCKVHKFYDNENIMNPFAQLELACYRCSRYRELINRTKPGHAILQAAQEIKKLIPKFSENSEAEAAVQHQFDIIKVLLDALEARKLDLGNHEESILEILLSIRSDINDYEVHKFYDNEGIMNTFTRLEFACGYKQLEHQEDESTRQNLASLLGSLGSFPSSPASPVSASSSHLPKTLQKKEESTEEEVVEKKQNLS